MISGIGMKMPQLYYEKYFFKLTLLSGWENTSELICQQLVNFLGCAVKCKD